MKLAYHTITWGGVVGHPAGVTSVKDLYYLANGSTEKALRDISSAGYEGFELFDGNLMQYAGREDELRNLTDGLGLQMVAVYCGANFIYPEILDDELSKIEDSARLAAQFGTEHLVVGGGAVRAAGIREEDYRRVGESLERVVAMADETGLVASYHPHLGTCVESPEQLAKVFQYTGIYFCPDTAHLRAGGGDPAELINAYGDRIRYVHLKDYEGGDFLPLGQGELDFARIMRALSGIQYDGWITVELDSYEGSSKEAAQISRRFLSEVTA
ncbi:MAG: sugar phosphate isomerase/epimerase family protein [Rubrobacteraceae bacterium]